jgi:serine/threonine protein kinase
MVLEFCAGGDLFWYIQAKACLDEQEAKRFSVQLLSALDYCQANLIAHRDIKLENILLDKKGNIKLADFGFAREVDGHSNTLLGSPIYTAGETSLGLTVCSGDSVRPSVQSSA